MTEEVIRSMMTAAAWERAKGALREFVVLNGYRRLTAPAKTLDEDHAIGDKWQTLYEGTEAFIKSIEKEGYTE